MAPVSSNADLLGRISLVYRIYFLYFEPVAALGGTYLCLFEPQRFLSGTVPLPAYTLAGVPIPVDPILTMMLTNIGALYVLFAINEGIVLRLTRERSVWFGIIIAMLCADFGHLYAAWAVSPARMFEILAWNSDEWINYGTLFLGAALRMAFLMGIGRK